MRVLSPLLLEGNDLLVRLRPSGLYQFFEVQPGRKFVIDGQPKLIGDLKTGTVLTATVTTKTQPASSISASGGYVMPSWAAMASSVGRDRDSASIASDATSRVRSRQYRSTSRYQMM